MLYLFLSIVLFIWFSAGITCLNMRKNLKRTGYDVFAWYVCFSPKKILSVVYGFLLKILIPEHIFEQMVLRKYDSYCRPNCIEGNNGHCDKCGCDTIAKMNSPFESCSRGMWGSMILSKRKYKQHRVKYPIEILTRYKNE